VSDRLKQQFSKSMRGLSTTLDDLGISVSTGRVVDFRVNRHLRMSSEADTVPLIYPAHFSSGYIVWPNQLTKKPNALKVSGAEVEDLLIPSGWYVLVRRFSAKEEKKRLVAAVYDPNRVHHSPLGVENHLNYYHQNGHGLLPELAKGLAAYLNSTLADEYFRQFSGHTQVNATDLRNLRYPNKEQLQRIGKVINNAIPFQDEVDRIIAKELNMGLPGSGLSESIQAKKKIDEALNILQMLGVPKAQINHRSALTLVALLDIKPETDWANARSPLLGITEMMDYFSDYFGVTYAPNTRETVRRQTVHQFVQMALVQINPDDPFRPTNSPFTRYQIEPKALQLLRTFGTYEWEQNLLIYQGAAQELKRLQVSERAMTMLPVKLPDLREIQITPSGQNILIKKIVEEFCPRYTPGGNVLYIGDAGEKLRLYEEQQFNALGVQINQHEKMPDVIVHMPDKNWLVLIEAVTSHGPIDIKRHNELKQLFHASQANLVFVTAFPSRKVMMKYLPDISWETDVWLAETPSHLIHFNGERFLGPY
jgi:adenine-specific DNA-methyltransferase